MALLVMAGMTAGCASTPESRIRKRPELFAGLAPETQELIREGRIELGFSPDMVELALGSPARRAVRKTASGDAEVWLYTRLESQMTAPELVPVHSYVRSRSGHVYSVPDVIWVDRDVWTERVYLRIEFSEGRVSAIETVPR